MNLPYSLKAETRENEDLVKVHTEMAQAHRRLLVETTRVITEIVRREVPKATGIIVGFPDKPWLFDLEVTGKEHMTSEEEKAAAEVEVKVVPMWVDGVNMSLTPLTEAGWTQLEDAKGCIRYGITFGG